MELPGGGGVWLAPSPSPPRSAVPDRHDEHGWGLLSGHQWGLYSWPRTPLGILDPFSDLARQRPFLVLARNPSYPPTIPTLAMPRGASRRRWEEHVLEDPSTRRAPAATDGHAPSQDTDA